MDLLLKSKRLWLIFCLALAAVLLTACAQGAPTPSAISGEEEAPSAPGDFDSGTRGVGENTAAERIVIQNARVGIIVDDPGQAMDQITQLAEEQGGFVVSAQLSQTTLSTGARVPQARITIRVPAEELNATLDAVLAMSSEEPEYKNLESQDVTREYVDLQSRLRNLENTEAQLTRIMEEANRTEDVLAVYNRLVEVREQIEVLKGQIQYYDESARLSAIAIELTANEAVQPIEVGGWRPGGVAKGAVEALIFILQRLGSLLIYVVIVGIPVLLLLYVIFGLPLQIGYILWRRRQKKERERTAQSAELPPAGPAQPE